MRGKKKAWKSLSRTLALVAAIACGWFIGLYGTVDAGTAPIAYNWVNTQSNAIQLQDMDPVKIDVYETVELQGGIAERFDRPLESVTWTYRWDSTFLSLHGVSEIYGIYHRQNSDNSLTVRWENPNDVDEGTVYRAAFEAVATTPPNRPTEIAVTDITAVDRQGRAYPVDLRNATRLVVRERPALVWFFRFTPLDGGGD